MSDRRSTPEEDESGPDLDELRSRLDALQGSVERLGREEPPAPGEPPQYEQSHPPQAPYDYAAAPPPPPVYEPPPADPYASYGAPPAAPDTYYEPPPAATNGGTTEELGLASVTILDAGPFADLIELRHFEEAVTRLDTVRDVHVRRFGHQRAKVEIGMIGDYAIGTELYRLGRPMQVELGPDGEIIVDFTDVPAEPEPEPVETAGAAGPATEAAEADDTGERSDTGEEEPG